jgi:NADH-quinone oxidoreductase subunit C
MAGILETVRARFGERLQESSEPLEEPTIVVDPTKALDVLRELRDGPDTAFEMLMDLTAVDYLGRKPRYEVVLQLYSLSKNHRLRVKIPVDDPDPSVPSMTPLWGSANWLEREAYDMYGVRFAGHPDLRRILMYPEFEGYPLRKDYPVMKRQPLIPERDPVENPWPPRLVGGKS